MDWRHIYIRHIAGQCIGRDWTIMMIRGLIHNDLLLATQEEEDKVLDEIVDNIRMMEDQVNHRFQYGT